jgi:alpha-glutamyl/putrescinyl thymine pyrophosphorylase clade 1
MTELQPRDDQWQTGRDDLSNQTLTLFENEPVVCRAQRFTPLEVVVEGRRLTTSPVFDTYWRFAVERQKVYFGRIEGHPGPWTDDGILRRHRFTNVYRAADRVSQFLISDVLYDGRERSWDEQVFRVLLFKFFNKIETWQALERALGDLSAQSFDHSLYAEVLDERRDRGDQNYSAAYMIPPPAFGESSKHRNHLRLLESMMMADLAGHLEVADDMSAAYNVLLSYPSVGRFLGYQFLIDLNYGTQLRFTEMDFVVAGPGARDGVRKCFGPAATGIEESVIAWVVATQDDHFERLGLQFRSLFGRPLQLIDAQNLFCEVDKYARVAHPDVPGVSGRTRIKQKFAARARPSQPCFPPQWGLSTGESYLERAPQHASQRRPSVTDHSRLALVASV